MTTAGVVEDSGHCTYSIGLSCFLNCHSLFHLVIYIYIYMHIHTYILLILAKNTMSVSLLHLGIQYTKTCQRAVHIKYLSMVNEFHVNRTNLGFVFGDTRYSLICFPFMRFLSCLVT